MKLPLSLRAWRSLKQRPPRSTWSQFLALVRGRRAAILVVVVASVVAGLAESGVLAIVAQIAAALVNKASVIHVSVGPLHMTVSVGFVLGIAAVLACLRLALQGVLSVVPARIVSEMQVTLRRDLLAAFTAASWSEQSTDREGHLQELLTNQATQAGQTLGFAANMLVAGVTFAVLVASALVLNLVAALLVLFMAIGLFALLRPLTKWSARTAAVLSKASLGFAGGVNENVRLAEEIQVFGAAAATRKRTELLLGAIRSPWYRLGVLVRLVPGIYQSLVYLFVVGGLAALYVIGSARVASLGAVILLLIRGAGYGQQAQTALQQFQQTLPYLERLQQALARYTENTPARGWRRLDTVRSISFDHVSFAYEPGRPVLSELDFEVAGGEAIGVVGPSGAGKSTLVQILLGLRMPVSGTYVINGVPAHEFLRSDWHGRVAYVPQEPRLLHATVASNIRFFRSLDDAAVEHAARLAGIHDDIVRWSAGYDTIVGPRADAVSGGQQQRICLARALAAQPEVLVLDEPTSALDPRTEAQIQESLAGLAHQLTLFVIAHRISTLDMCDRVMVINHGCLEAFDRISELRMTSDYYRLASAINQ